jgi:RNA polymerase sigma-70 factor (ECF subfamily)
MEKQNSLNSIINGCKKGLPGDFDKLIDMYSKRCYGYFYRLTGNSAQSEDLLGELFLKLVKKIGSFKSKNCSFESWLFTLAGNIFRDHLRSKYRVAKLLDSKAEMERLDQPPPRSEERVIDNLQIEFEKLDSETRELLMMRFYGGFSFRELAKIRSEPIGTTLSKVHRGLKKLKEQMEQNND